jgi:flagellar biosynthesis chaperone FliJ
VKKFRFSLEKLLHYRQARLAVEQARLDRILAEQRALAERRAALGREERLVMENLRRLPVLTSSELEAAASFRRFARSEAVRLLSLEGELVSRLERQRQAVVEARRGVEALEQLRARKHESWRREVDRELENQVAELVVARWKRGEEAG